MIQEFRCTLLRLTDGHSDSSASTLHRLTFSRNFIKLTSASTIPQAPRSRLHSASATGGAAEVRHCFWRFGSKRNAGRSSPRSELLRLDAIFASALGIRARSEDVCLSIFI